MGLDTSLDIVIARSCTDVAVCECCLRDDVEDGVDNNVDNTVVISAGTALGACTVVDALGVVTADVDVDAIAAEVVLRMGVTGDGTAVIESKDEAEEDVTAVGIDTGRILAPASYSLASSFSARRVTSANFAEMASTAVRLPPICEASSASAILQKRIRQTH